MASATITAIRPQPQAVGRRAVEILARIEDDQEYNRLIRSAYLYPDTWTSLTGVLLVRHWNINRDLAALVGEALRVLALKAAVYELTHGNEAVAELRVPPPVDELIHAVLAQHTVCVRIQARTDITLPHMTDHERGAWEPGDYTEQCYRAVGWGDPPARYWLGAAEARRRLHVLKTKYLAIRIFGGGRNHDLDFGVHADGPPPPAG